MAATNSAKATHSKTAEEPLYVYLHLLPDESGVAEVDQRVTITVNGVNRIIPRGQRVEVTLPEYEALLNSGKFETL